MNSLSRLLDSRGVDSGSVDSRTADVKSPTPGRRPGARGLGAGPRTRLPVITLTEGQFLARHRVLRRLLWGHLLVVTVIAVIAQPATAPMSHRMLTWVFVALALACATGETVLRARRRRALATAVGLLMCAGALVHATGGQTDMHFDFFVALALIGLYQDWLPFAAAIGLVGIHHAVIGTLLPHAVYSTPAAQAHPVRYALIHAGFVAAMCAAQIAYWRFSAAAEAALAQAHTRADLLSLVAEYTDNAVVITDSDGVVLWVNAAFTRVTGYTRDEAIGRTRRSMLHLAAARAGERPDAQTPPAGGRLSAGTGTGSGRTADEGRLDDLLRRAVSGEDVEVEVLTRDGRPYWTDLQVRPIPFQPEATSEATTGARSRSAALIGVERDITARREAARAVEEASARAMILAGELDADKRILDSVLSAIPHLVAWHDIDGTMLGSNSAYSARLPADAADDGPDARAAAQGANGADELAAAIRSMRAAVLGDGRPRRDQHVTALDPGQPDGATRQYLVTVLPLDPEGAPGFTDPAVHHGAGGDDSSIEAGRAGVAVATPEAEVAGAVVGVLTVVTDVTEIASLERQLAQTHRLEALGQLAAGIAHEINTPIQFVTDNTRFVADSLNDVLNLVGSRSADADREATDTLRPSGTDSPDTTDTTDTVDVDFLAEELPRALSDSLEGLRRVADIVRAMKEFSHPGSGLAAVDLENAVRATVQITRNEWKHVAEVEVSVEPDLPPVTGYEGELKQALLNLVVNAAHAVRARQAGGDPGRGRISITVRTAAAAPAQVEIIVADDGTGMTEAVRRRVFDPFFTTKPVGQGTGQGLTLVHNVVTKHRGTITIDSAPGRGTAFTICIPAAS